MHGSDWVAATSPAAIGSPAARTAQTRMPARNFGTRNVIFMPCADVGVDDEAEVVAERRAHPVVDVAQPDVRPGLVGVGEVLVQRAQGPCRRRRPRR